MAGIKLGTRIKTVSVMTKRDYSDIGMATRRPNKTGTVVKEHNSHGICYEVYHEVDSTVGCYDPDELIIIE